MRFVLIFVFIGLLKLNNAFSQCVINSSGCGGYFLSITIQAKTIVPSSYTCPFGYNYNVQFSYSITVSGVNTCYNGSIGIQPQIFCNSQNNGYYTINVPAPNVGSGASSTSYTGTLTTGTNPFSSATDCNTATPSSLNCNSLQITVFGPGIPTTTYPCTLSSLPIELLTFTGKCEDNHVDLKWVTATETNNAYFTIEKSIDAINWAVISTIKGAGNSVNKINYAYSDLKSSNEIAYYRLKQIDIDGSFKYSEIVDVDCNDNSTALIIFPNPSNGLFYFSKKGNKISVNSMEIYNTLGERIYKSYEEQSILDMSNIDKGVYFIHFMFEKNKYFRKIIIE